MGITASQLNGSFPLQASWDYLHENERNVVNDPMQMKKNVVNEKNVAKRPHSIHRGLVVPLLSFGKVGQGRHKLPSFAVRVSIIFEEKKKA